MHFIEGGSGADALALDVFLGPCVVVDASGVEGEIGAELVRGLETERVLFKTRNSELWARESFSEEYVRIGADAARLLVERGVPLVGIDYLSVGGPETHRTLLSAGVAALEGLDLRRVEPGRVPARLPAAEDRRVGRRGGARGSAPRLAERGTPVAAAGARPLLAVTRVRLAASRTVCP